MADNSSNSLVQFPRQGRKPLAEEKLVPCLVLDEASERRLLNPGRVFVYEDRGFTTQDQLARYLAQQHTPPVSVGTIWNWLRRYDAAIREGRDPLAALCDQRRSDANRSRFFDRHPAAAAFVQRRAAVNGATGRKVYRELCRQWPEVAADNPPSYTTLLQYLKLLKRQRRAARRARGAA